VAHLEAWAEAEVYRMERAKKEQGDTWPKMLRYNCEKYGDSRKAMRYKRYGVWQPFTWKDYYLEVKHLALGLLSLGFAAGDRLLIVGDNGPQWYSGELAAQANHGISVGVYSDLTPPEMRHIARNSGAVVALVQDQEQVDKLLEIKDEVPALKRIVYWSSKGLSHYDDPLLMGYRQVLERGEEYEGEHPGLFEENVEKGKADDLCALVYTSGTTGSAPKGALHTYRSMRAGAEFYLRLDPWQESDNIVPYVPPAWMTEQWIGIGCHLLSASTLNLAEEPETQRRDMREIGPTIVVHRARLWESQAAMVKARILGVEGLRKLAFRLFMPLGYRMADLRFQRRKAAVPFRMLYALADMVLFRRIRESLGLSHARICYSTGALLSPDAHRFYHALNLPLKSVYGTTEGGALTGAKNGEILPSTVGPAFEGCEVRITGRGEIVYRQAGSFVGYHGDPQTTAAVLEDGWFHSGDSGFVREDGHLVFLDRMESLVELAGGGRLAPQSIECLLRSSPYIRDAWVFAGLEKTYASAIIVINYERVARWAGQRRVAYNSFAELSQAPLVYELVKQDVEKINRTLPPDSRVERYLCLDREFDPDEGDLTRTRELRRPFLEGRYRGLIEAIYAGREEVSPEADGPHREEEAGARRNSLRIISLGGTAS